VHQKISYAGHEIVCSTRRMQLKARQCHAGWRWAPMRVTGSLRRKRKRSPRRWIRRRRSRRSGRGGGSLGGILREVMREGGGGVGGARAGPGRSGFNISQHLVTTSLCFIKGHLLRDVPAQMIVCSPLWRLEQPECSGLNL
jgi:hypothetical protein